MVRKILCKLGRHQLVAKHDRDGWFDFRCKHCDFHEGYHYTYVDFKNILIKAEIK